MNLVRKTFAVDQKTRSIRKTNFYVKIEFANLNDEKYVKVLELSKLEREIEIRSDIISNEKYDITHIVVEKFITSNGFEMSWECLSDKPKSSLSMED